MDNGDILQGQPTAYYYNYIDTVAPHLAAEMMNFMGYNAGNMGNHDVETGRTVFDRWAGDCRFPILGANIVDTATGETHFKPYEVLERDGVKIVVLGMITLPFLYGFQRICGKGCVSTIWRRLPANG